MNKPKMVEVMEAVTPEQVLFAESDAVAGDILLHAFAKAMAKIKPELDQMNPVKDNPIRVVVMVQAVGTEKPKEAKKK